MITPTAHHLEGFFHGLAHGQKISGQTVRGKTGANAIGRELTTLKLLKECYNVPTSPQEDVRPDYGDEFLAPFLPKDTGPRAIGETGAGPFRAEPSYGPFVRRAKNIALIGLSGFAVACLVITICLQF